MPARGYIARIRSRGEERWKKASIPGHTPRRWVVEAARYWMNRFRKLLIRFEKIDNV